MTLAVYPSDVRGFTINITKTPIWQNIVQHAPSANETRILQSQNPTWKWIISYDYLYNNVGNGLNNDLLAGRSNPDLQILMGFFLARRGRNEEFLWLDPEDNHVTLQQLALIQDPENAGQWYSPVQRNMGSQFQEDITDVFGAFEVRANGVLKIQGVHYTLVGPGLALAGTSYAGIVIHWASAPTGPITASFNFYFRVRFDSDEQDFERFLSFLWTIGGHGKQGRGYIELKSVRPRVGQGDVIGPTNAAPVPDAGDDFVTDAGILVYALLGSATDDGLPSPPAAITYTWTKNSGPGGAVFDDLHDPTTNVTVDAAGDYVFRLTATDGALTAHDDVAVTFTAEEGGCPDPAATYTSGFDDAPDPADNIGTVCDWLVDANAYTSANRQVTVAGGKLVWGDNTEHISISNSGFSVFELIAGIADADPAYLEIEVGATTTAIFSGGTGSTFLHLVITFGVGSTWMRWDRQYNTAGAIHAETLELYDTDNGLDTQDTITTTPGDTIGFKNDGGQLSAYLNGSLINTFSTPYPQDLNASLNFSAQILGGGVWTFQSEIDNFKFNVDTP